MLPVDLRNRILTLDGSYHFGDNPGIFQGSSFVGHSISLPMHLAWVDTSKDNIFIIVRTTDVETWGTWKGHKVSIDHEEIGRLRDPDDAHPEGTQVHTLTVARELFEQLVGSDRNFTFIVELEAQESTAGLADDFTLTRIETVNCTCRLGWQG